MISDESLDFYELIAIESPVLDEIERHLRQRGEVTLADELNQFQVDAALEFQWVVCGGKDTPTGHEIDKIWEAHTQITPGRFSVFYKIADTLSESELRDPLLLIIHQIPKVSAAPSIGPCMTREI